MKKMTKKARIYICVGLILNSVPFLVKESSPLLDFFKGFMYGLALVLLLKGMLLQRSSGRRSGCSRQVSQGDATPENKQPA
jgi:hypothetical protein